MSGVVNQSGEKMAAQRGTHYDRRAAPRGPASADMLQKKLAGRALAGADVRLEDVDKAYERRRIKHADELLSQLLQHEPYYYSHRHNRAVLNKLAHPIQKKLAISQYGGTPAARLGKEIEAIYGNGVDQLEFLLNEYSSLSEQERGIRANVEGGLSELSVFLLTARQLTGDTTDEYFMTPSTEAEDNADHAANGACQGFDFKVWRPDFETAIPLQVKTHMPKNQSYTRRILVVAVSNLLQDYHAAPATLAEELHAELTGDASCNSDLINTASDRLFGTFDTYGLSRSNRYGRTRPRNASA